MDRHMLSGEGVYVAGMFGVWVLGQAAPPMPDYSGPVVSVVSVLGSLGLAGTTCHR